MTTAVLRNGEHSAAGRAEACHGYRHTVETGYWPNVDELRSCHLPEHGLQEVEFNAARLDSTEEQPLVEQSHMVEKIPRVRVQHEGQSGQW
ncbi:hypothetical protein [Streptomyces sp. H34-S4]|uniref:hypothetical protein n=1 Tax=Streptomyces sp. H34-S4 TaxID=2996463 RepID=UPI0022716699|nr:hypothetical protein [Streptomyces sp. H34-S4]MCY0933942.1 hypothetical protein [Streptomyces sp. H34-S4]